MKKAMVYLQSGGPTSVINTSLFGAIVEARNHPQDIETIYGSHFGVEGLIKDDLIDLTDIPEEKLSLLKQTPGSVLGSSRHRLAEEDYEFILATILKRNIGYVFVNGGNDSMDTSNKLGKYFASKGVDVKVIGVPKTMDNDLINTDHTPGFASSAKYVVNTVKSLVIDGSCYSEGKIILVEVMGRDSGWNAAAGDVLEEPYRPDCIYFLENHFDYASYLREIQETKAKKGYCLCLVSEGIELPRGESTTGIDAFGHVNLEGVSYELAKRTKKDIGVNVRSIPLSIPTRCSPLLVSGVDQKEAFEVGAFAVRSALKGKTRRMVSIVRDSSYPYRAHYELTPVEEVANSIKLIPNEFIVDHRRLSDSFRDYMKPLLEGKSDSVIEKDGIVESFKF